MPEYSVSKGEQEVRPARTFLFLEISKGAAYSSTPLNQDFAPQIFHEKLNFINNKYDISKGVKFYGLDSIREARRYGLIEVPHNCK